MSTRATTRKTPPHGFTLIEVMLVATLVAVLASIALPHYTAYVQRSHRAHARAALLQAAQWLERAATVQGRYPERKGIPAGVLAVEGDRYTLAFKSLDASTFQLRASPQGPQGADPCGAFELNEAGVRTQSPTPLVAATLPAQTCWNR